MNLMGAQLKGASDENTKGVIICPVIREGEGQVERGVQDKK